MPFLELYGVAAACATFGHSWTRKKVICLCDCEPAELAMNKRYSPVPEMQMLIRAIGLIAATMHFDIRIKHIPGLLNVRADPLSRLNVSLFRAQNPSADSSATPVLPLPHHNYE